MSYHNNCVSIFKQYALSIPHTWFYTLYELGPRLHYSTSASYV